MQILEIPITKARKLGSTKKWLDAGSISISSFYNMSFLSVPSPFRVFVVLFSVTLGILGISLFV
jgi:hypothetical protein